MYYLPIVVRKNYLSVLPQSKYSRLFHTVGPYFGRSDKKSIEIHIASYNPQQLTAAFSTSSASVQNILCFYSCWVCQGNDYASTSRISFLTHEIWVHKRICSRERGETLSHNTHFCRILVSNLVLDHRI